MQKLRFLNPDHSAAKNAGRSTWGINEYITNFKVDHNENYILPRGVASWLIELSKYLNIKFEVSDERTLKSFHTIDSTKLKLKPYQADAITELVSLTTNGILISPAGSGKTVMGLSIMSALGQPTIWLTHTNNLMIQTSQRATSMFEGLGEVGFIGSGKFKIGDKLTIAMIQTLVRNPEKMAKLENEFGMVIVDECHRTPSRTFTEAIGMFNSYYTYGLTATPYRRDKLEALMYQSIGEDSVEVPLDKVKESGGIMVPKVWYKTVNSRKYDNNDIQKILKMITDNVKRNHMIAGDVIKEAVEGNFCIVISDRKQHCELLYELISIGWPKTGIATGKYSKKYVQEQVDRFNAHEITVLVATSALLGEGFDVPFLNRGFLAMPFRGRTKTEQVLGRIQRSSPGKKDAILYDYVDVDIGVLKNQFHSKYGECRYRTYTNLGAVVEPYKKH